MISLKQYVGVRADCKYRHVQGGKKWTEVDASRKGSKAVSGTHVPSPM